MKHLQNKYGFSDTRIWPLYFIFSCLILLLLPVLGIVWGTLVPLVIMMFVSSAIYAYTVKHDLAEPMPSDEELLKTLPKFLQEAGGTIQPKEPLQQAPVQSPALTK